MSSFPRLFIFSSTRVPSPVCLILQPVMSLICSIILVSHSTTIYRTLSLTLHHKDVEAANLSVKVGRHGVGVGSGVRAAQLLARLPCSSWIKVGKLHDLSVPVHSFLKREWCCSPKTVCKRQDCDPWRVSGASPSTWSAVSYYDSHHGAQNLMKRCWSWIFSLNYHSLGPIFFLSSLELLLFPAMDSSSPTATLQWAPV